MLQARFLDILRFRVAEIAVGASALRNQGAPGVVSAARTFLKSLDLAFFSQSLHHALHPRQAVCAAYRILKPGGRIVILDLKRHGFEQARDLYADTWLGFSEVELRAFLEAAGFENVESWIVDREKQNPAFETILAIGSRPAPIQFNQ